MTIEEKYNRVYASRHGFDLELVNNNAILRDCAAYEYLMHLKQLTLPEARRRIVEKYPDTNCITGLRSVLNLITPSNGCLRELKDQDWRYYWKEQSND